MRNLPKVYEGKVRSDINNTQKLFYGSDREVIKTDNISIVRKINNIFSSKDHVYKSKVNITLKDKNINKVIVGKNSTNLITIDGELIKITDILDIKKIY